MVKLFILFIAFTFSSLSFSFEVDSKMLQENLSQVKLDKSQVNQMLELLVAQGKITSAQKNKAQKELEGMSDEQLQELTQKAVKHVEKASENGGENLDDYLEGIQ